MTPNEWVSEIERRRAIECDDPDNYVARYSERNAIHRRIQTEIIAAAIEDRDKDWSHALKQAVESQFPEWSDFHEWPASPDVEYMCAWLRRVIAKDVELAIIAAVEEEREACALIVERNKFLEPGEVADLIRARSDAEARK